MLVVSRKVGEQIVVGHDVVVTVVRISGGGVRLGVQAPPETVIVREELCRGEPAQVQASSTPSADSRGGADPSSASSKPTKPR